MREVVLRVPRGAVEDVLDRLLLIVPGGVRESPKSRHVELSIRGEDLPTAEALRQAIGRWPHRVIEREVSDDWRERRVADYAPEIIRGRLIVRPEWAPAARSQGGSHELLEIVLGESAAFGGGTHPTTRACLELLLELPPRGSFADLGCGSGVLAILAARLGWKRVIAIDIQPASVEAARENAQRNGAVIEARAADLATHTPPGADGFAANFPAALHQVVAAAWKDPVPQIGLLSGFSDDEAAGVIEAYASRGLHPRGRVDVHSWTVLVVGPG